MGHLVPRQSGTRATDGHGARAPVGCRRRTPSRGTRRGRGHVTSNGRRRRARGGHSLPLRSLVVRGHRMRHQRRRDRAHAGSARHHAVGVGRRRRPPTIRRRARRRSRRRERGRGARVRGRHHRDARRGGALSGELTRGGPARLAHGSRRSRQG